MSAWSQSNIENGLRAQSLSPPACKLARIVITPPAKCPWTTIRLKNLNCQKYDKHLQCILSYPEWQRSFFRRRFFFLGRSSLRARHAMRIEILVSSRSLRLYLRHKEPTVRGAALKPPHIQSSQPRLLQRTTQYSAGRLSSMFF
jgi:hypothetical protein